MRRCMLRPWKWQKFGVEIMAKGPGCKQGGCIIIYGR
jgi:hypothetical protein